MKAEMEKYPSQVMKGIRSILFDLGSLEKNDHLCIISDTGTSKIAQGFQVVAEQSDIKCEHLTIAPMKIHGEEPPGEVFNAMQRNNLIIGLTGMSMAHTKARKLANEKGNRYLSLPEYSFELLGSESLLFDFKGILPDVKRLTAAFDNASKIEIRTDAGTDLYLDATARKGNCCPGFVNDEFCLGSPPDVESNITLVEDRSSGKVIVDGSVPIPEIGFLETPLTLHIDAGKIIRIESENQQHVDILNKLFDSYGPESRVLAELGVGFNKRAALCGNMLVDEGAYGTIHLGFGSNVFLGGKNSAGCHVDFVFFANTLIFDGVDFCI